MKVEYQLEPSDLIAFSREHQRFVPKSLPGVYYFVVLPALGVALAVTADSFLLGMSFTLAYMLAGFAFQSLIQKRNRESIFSNENLSFGVGRWEASLSKEGVTFSSEAAVALYRWPAIREVFRGSNYLYFVLTPLYRPHIPCARLRTRNTSKLF